MNIIDIIPVARGKQPADLLLKNARIVNVFSGEIERANIAIFRKRIAGIGDYSEGKQVIDLHGAYVVPGLIDAHLHIESSMVSPVEFAKTVLPRGTTTVIADPHEIANVLGLDGVEYLIKSTEGVPLNLYIMLPSSVPATNLENNGARISVMDMIGFVEKHPRVLGLGEVMNYPDIINGDHDSIAKIELLRHKYKKIDGHIPGISGKDLNAYICAFIRSDHECTNVEEAKEKLARGMQILVREGSVARNLDELLPLINEKNYPFISFCTDDKHPNDILNEGHIDYMIRYAIKKGIDPITAVRAATINTARHYNLRSMGAIAPGYKADFVIVDNLEEFRISMVFKDSKLIAENGKLVIDINREQFPLEEVNTFKCPHIEEKDLEVLNKGENIRVIRVYGDDVLTKELRMEPKTKDGRIVSDVNRDILKVASICRYCEEKSMAIGFINGTGLKQGAVATSVGHDAHNMSVIGTNDADMVVAANRVIDMGGGLVIANSGKVLAELPLPIAGLMSNLSSKEVAERLGHLKTVLKELGCEVPDLFMTLSFVQLSVIPELRITNQGLVDVINNNFVSLFIGKEG
ncbi:MULTISPECIES: adenine deaminase [Kosmotoga]|uniref:Adenine deaminase n=1 Tax=Kosmotoga olearia (strain ATCC BAA-1733 / DSM 21960 / TBF 19.5.1) TaxID=521045 RepID=ADEC_KOSOT|nr:MULTISPECIES: adenine deaminase [Kosmotoga]C5CI63.1 RecName: Full=Adenine deaminase; Short=Adenase; Short=Adenine aminase [Kosmotoga olearia TBF 19.5.1]ACR80765.1 adenine deaminase [Kosmotoga olearia TBF 19.5.1]OAA19207.1 adenine deaminase [Kosmotoga sp. DU53]